MTALPTLPLATVSDDVRRTVQEAAMTLPDGATFRLGVIACKDDAPSGTRLGDHSHPAEETFLVAKGEFVLYLLDAADVTGNPDHIDRDKISAQTVVEGETLVIPAGTVHTFVPTVPGSVLHSYARAPFTKDWIVGCKLPITPGL
jgi:mannose-6-phosphate isomerase-like protein (cupin superfamily)